MESVKVRRSTVKGQITRAVSFAESIDPSTQLELLKHRLVKLDESWSLFCSLNDEYLVLGSAIRDFNSTEVESEFGDYEAKYFNAYASISRAITERQPLSQVPQDPNDSILERLAVQQSTFLEKLNVASNTTSSVNLPKIVIPSFSGNYKDWPSFRDMFVGSVATKSCLTPTQKFHYLKSFLRDDAASLIKHIPISDATYLEAWARLEERYDKKLFIVNSFIRSYLSLPTMTSTNLQTLRKIVDGADEVVRGLSALRKSGRDPWLIYLLVGKLDQDSAQAWAEHIGARDDCTIDELLKFLQGRCNALESCEPNRLSSRLKTHIPIRSHLTENTAEARPKCVKCQGSHILSQCPQFVSLNTNSRRELVKGKSLCFNCLRGGHTSNKCRSTFRCRICQSRHHSLVHPDDPPVPSQGSSPTHTPTSPLSPVSVPSNMSASPLLNNLSTKPTRKQTILPTILANIKDIQGNLVVCRALLDSGSQSSFVLESLVQKLGYTRSHARIPILGLSSLEAGFTKGQVSLQLHSLVSSSSLYVDAYILSKLTSNLPYPIVDASLWTHLDGLQLADPKFNVTGPIDILLGADTIWKIFNGGQIRGSSGAPFALNTSFGWVITGEISRNDSLDNILSSFHSTVDIDGILRRFWEIEHTVPSKEELCSQDPAELHFRETFSRAPDGKYVVPLPFKSPCPSFGETLSSAISRLYSMERRFRHNPDLRRMYSEFMKEYLELNHMSPIPPDELSTLSGKHFYLPHHAVFRLDSSTTKLRVVFDGSAKDSRGVSLNSELLVGPPIQRELIKVCLRFRQHKFVFTADVVKMFRQIWIDENHTDFQRIVWRENPTDEIQHFRLRTVTYGTASAPFLSVRVLRQLAEDYETQFPNASRVLVEDVYVDDVMTGSNTEDGLIALQSELVSLLSQAGLQLRKWTSNCRRLLSMLPKEDCDYSAVETERSSSIIKVLGMFWSPLRDDLSFRMSKQLNPSEPTRRTLLSEVSRIFDPLGLLAPSVILFKILFQELWSASLNLGWDDPLPAPIAQRWTTYREELCHFENISVPRIISPSLDKIELHGFCDASLAAYAAVVYSRYKTRNGEFKVQIVASKTRVAPLKPVSIPRLELCGAVLLTRLLALITSLISISSVKVFAWCDSEIVLHWLSSPPRRWTTFVANRAATILESLPRNSWHHITSEFNPTDCASRGITPSSLLHYELWWKGPPWLSSDSSCWPKSKFDSDNLALSDLEERMSQSQVLITTCNNDLLDLLMKHTSSWYTMQRVMAWCLRFVANCRSTKSNRLASFLTSKEIQVGKTTLLKLIQNLSFSNDIQSLAQNRQLPTKSKLIKYSPFIDKDGVLRVGGRIRHAPVSFNIKHPILLCSKQPISRLIIREIHNQHLHPGVSTTFALVRQQFWVLGCRNLVKNVVFRCKPCFLQRKQTSEQLMGDLPSYRTQPIRPFANSGCDYAGPITIKLSRTRKPKLAKAYIALFICMTTKAMHLELVSDLTTDAFIAALRRFVARRGKCSHIYTDNGTNFQGARRVLTELHNLVLSQSHNELVATALARDGISWHFSPPSAPHFGGLWEAGVKSVKHHLRRVLGLSVLTFEELCTVLCQIEAVVNSRPLCSMSASDLNPLTPAHFLIGEPLTAVPDPDCVQSPVTRLEHFRSLQAMVQGFWKRWHLEYLTTLQERPKWQKSNDNIRAGDLVVLKEPNLPPTKWILGRITNVKPGQDGKVRVAEVKTASGIFIRPITKMALLPIS